VDGKRKKTEGKGFNPKALTGEREEGETAYRQFSLNLKLGILGSETFNSHLLPTLGGPCDGVKKNRVCAKR